MTKAKITTTDVRALLLDKFSDSRQFACAEEVGNATGLEQKRRLDFVVVDCFRSNGYSIHGFEIKVSKPDLRRELQDSSKHNIFFPSIDYYSLAAPAEVVDVSLIPKTWGLYLVDRLPDETLKLRTYRKPLSLHDQQQKEIDKGFAVCLMRALYNQSPSKSQIALAKDKARAEALFELRQDADHRKIERLEDELKAFAELQQRFGFWGSGDIERAMSDFEEFRNLRPQYVIRALENVGLTVSRELKALKDRVGGDER